MTELLLRVTGASRPGDRSADVIAAVDPAHRVGDLVVALAAQVDVDLEPHDAGLGIVRTGQVARPDLPLDELDLLSGDEVIVGPSAARLATPGRVPRRAWALDITAGPDSGRSTILTIGSTTVGRSSRCDLVLGDRSVSRRHATIHLATDGTFTVTPAPDASNGVTVDGNSVAHGMPTPFTPGAVLGLGGTRAVVRSFECRPGGRRDRLSQVDFHRTPYRRPVIPQPEPAPVGPIPTRPEARRFHALAAIAPLAAGLAMFSITGRAYFLLFTLISPIVMIGTAIDDRRAGRRNYRKRVAEFRDMLAERRSEYERLRAVERAERLRAAPDLAALVRRAELRTIDLWPRGRDADDFLRLRVGLGDDEVMFPIELERDGDDDLRAEALAALDGLRRVTHVPVIVDLATHALGVHGDLALVDGTAASLAMQIATLHSPDDVTIVAALAPERGLSWLKWLPHVRSVTSPVAGDHVVSTTAAADGLVKALLDVADFRTAERRSDGDRQWPRVVALLDAALEPDPAATARLLDVSGAADISVIWLAASAADVPRQADRVLHVVAGDGARMEGRVWATDAAVADRHVEVEHIRQEIAERAARALASVRDASTASLATSIPRTAPLLDVLGLDEVGPDRIAVEWAADRGYQLRFPIGFAADGPLELDLVADGPHSLIGGTSGAGKSELLQSMVAALAVHHSPERLNFLFVDYKGGASSQVFERLPHTVGYVTNLSADLSLRALTSLRAELDRRMALMEGRAKDLAEMLERYPGEAPASLVIVVDEFATLVKEVPDFVAGVVDVAQRGRSLGIHLVLATQRPSGSVNENILANTNLRVSLRMLDRTESTAVIDSPDAADIPVPLRGRGMIRVGPRQVVEFQSAFAGAPVTNATDRRPVLVAPFERPGVTPVGAAAEQADVTHLEVVLDAIAAADQRLGLPAPRRPWRDVLPAVITLDSIWDAAVDADVDTGAGLRTGRAALVGMLDAPETQDQHPAVVDLEERGGLLVYGSGGTGKTTLLRTIASSVHRGGGAATLVFDFASRGLTSLRPLPTVIDVATGDDLEAVTRHLLLLDAELDRRRRLLADSGAEHLTAYGRDHPDEPLDRIIVLIDGFGGLAAGLLDAGGSTSAAAADRWSEIVHRIVVDGRQVGIHTVITSDRRNAVPSRIQSAVGARLILRHADPQSYADLGVRGDVAEALDASAGRALLDGRVTVQIASVSADPAARAQADAIAELVRVAQSDDSAVPHMLASAALPDVVTEHHLDGALDGAHDSGLVGSVIGLCDVTMGPAVLDVAWSHAAVVGPVRSGRSTALAAFVSGARVDRASPDNLYVVGPTSSPLAELDAPRAAFGRADQVGALLDRIANLAAVAAADERLVVVVDDIDGFDDPALAPIWERLAGSDLVRLVASFETRSMTGYTTNAAVAALRRSRRMLVLQPDDPSEFLQLTGVKLPVRPGLRMVPGRGVLLADRTPSVIQITHGTATTRSTGVASV